MEYFNKQVVFASGPFNTIRVQHDLHVKSENVSEVQNLWNAGISALFTDIIENKMGNKELIPDTILFGLSLLSSTLNFGGGTQKYLYLKLIAQEYLNFGSNCRLILDVESGEVTFNSHGLEELTYASFDDFYRHYRDEGVSDYHYSALIGTYDDNSENIEFENELYDELLSGVLIDLDGSDIFSDQVPVTDSPGYSQRECPIQYKGIVLS